MLYFNSCSILFRYSYELNLFSNIAYESTFFYKSFNNLSVSVLSFRLFWYLVLCYLLFYSFIVISVSICLKNLNKSALEKFYLWGGSKFFLSILLTTWLNSSSNTFLFSEVFLYDVYFIKSDEFKPIYVLLKI